MEENEKQNINEVEKQDINEKVNELEKSLASANEKIENLKNQNQDLKDYLFNNLGKKDAKEPDFDDYNLEEKKEYVDNLLKTIIIEDKPQEKENQNILIIDKKKENN